jgi:vacuolar-type H+-ATPase subunit I/STV1
MERHIAIKKLTKLLGKGLGYRVDPKAYDAEDRANMKIQRALREELREAVRKRCNALLSADQEYQRLKAELNAANEAYERLSAINLSYRFTAGVSRGPFFVIKAQGDSWEEVIAKIAKEREAKLAHLRDERERSTDD